MHNITLQAFYAILMTSNCNDRNFGPPNEMNSATCQSGGLFVHLLVHVIRKVLFKHDNFKLQTSKLSFSNCLFHTMDHEYHGLCIYIYAHWKFLSYVKIIIKTCKRLSKDCQHCGIIFELWHMSRSMQKSGLQP